jgi:hypothetical protein
LTPSTIATIPKATRTKPLCLLGGTVLAAHLINEPFRFRN